jgi:murein DD-endopeptidase MepM/ murein hydrolase activator NlpD
MNTTSPLLFIFLLLAITGCAAPPTSTPTVAPRDPPLPTRTVAPITPLPTSPPLSTATAPRPTATPTPSPAPTATLAPLAPQFGYPIGAPGRTPGDGFFIRHGAGVENTWYNPGFWHTGEDWYAVEGDTAGAAVYAIADGLVEYVGSNYPGRVVIIRHADDLFSMYGHLDPAVSVGVGDTVVRGAQIGVVLRRSDDVPNHLHFEVRTFLIAQDVNGDAPRYDFRCGVRCPPGPGYWPIRAPDLPRDLGWLIPTHVIAQRMFPGATGSLGEVIVASQVLTTEAELWSAPPDAAARNVSGALALVPGERFPLLGIYTGPEDAGDTSALAYQLWYELALPGGGSGWVQAALHSPFETGGDGRPSSVYFHFFPGS